MQAAREAATALLALPWELLHDGKSFLFQGAKPTHPALLDYLAQDLIDNGWKLKRLHKKIMLSQTYRLGTSNHAENQKADPKNRYWWKRDPADTLAVAIERFRSVV